MIIVLPSVVVDCAPLPGRWWLANNFDGAFGNPIVNFLAFATGEPYEFASYIPNKHFTFNSDVEQCSKN
jgi:hypothetical protein